MANTAAATAKPTSNPLMTGADGGRAGRAAGAGAAAVRGAGPAAAGRAPAAAGAAGATEALAPGGRATVAPGLTAAGAPVAPGGGAPPAGNVGSLIVGAEVGLGGKLMRTVSFFGWTLPVSFLGGSPPEGGLGGISAIIAARNLGASRRPVKPINVRMRATGVAHAGGRCSPSALAPENPCCGTFHRPVGILRGRVLDEGETARFAGHPIEHHVH